ncbi:MAG: phage portal protein [Actinomycetota bacterium]|nr:phage portal protein [Actinomycetota bacterium]
MPSLLTSLLGGDGPNILGLTKDQQKGVDLAESCWPEFMTQLAVAERADKWARGENDQPSLPAEFEDDPEYQELREVTPTPWLSLVVTGTAQNLYVEGHESAYKPGTDPEATQTKRSDVWARLWQPNRMDSRQMAVHRGALAHGVSYVMLERARISFVGEKSVRLRGVSAMKGAALWRTDGDDEFPLIFIEANRVPAASADAEHWEVKVTDEKYTWTLHRKYSEMNERDARGRERDSDWTYISHEPHGFPVCPVVRFANDLDLEGRIQGEVTPFIPLARRIDQDTFDRLIVQRFGSWKIRTIAGMNIPEDPVKKRQMAQFLRVNDLLLSSSDKTRFGTLEGTPLEGYIAARDSDIRDLAAVTQTPPHHLLGLSPNVSAEGLVEAQAGLMRKVDERQHLFGESWELVMRLGAYVLGMNEAAADFEAQMKWRDTESRSMAQVADALGKLATMVGVPVQMLWERIPGWTQQNTDRAKEILDRQQEEMEMLALLEAGARDVGASKGPGDGLSSPPGKFRGAKAPGGILEEAERRRVAQQRDGQGEFA